MPGAHPLAADLPLAFSLELQPTFRVTGQLAGVACAPELALKLGKALRAAGLPE